MLRKAIPSMPLHLIFLEQIDSTHAFAKRKYVDFSFSSLTRISAKSQTNGCGREKKKWFSPPKVNVYTTYFFTLPKTISSLSNLSQLFSITLFRLLTKYAISAQIKWPNDLLIRGKKIAGILSEFYDLSSHFGVFLSVGMNVNMPKEMTSMVDRPITSMHIETGKRYTIPTLLRNLDTFFIEDLQIYKKKGFAPFLYLYHSQLLGKNSVVSYSYKKEKKEAVLKGINQKGELLLQLPNGEYQFLRSGEIQLLSFPNELKNN